MYFSFHDTTVSNLLGFSWYLLLDQYWLMVTTRSVQLLIGSYRELRKITKKTLTYVQISMVINPQLHSLVSNNKELHLTTEDCV